MLSPESGNSSNVVQLASTCIFRPTPLLSVFTDVGLVAVGGRFLLSSWWALAKPLPWLFTVAMLKKSISSKDDFKLLFQENFHDSVSVSIMHISNPMLASHARRHPP